MSPAVLHLPRAHARDASPDSVLGLDDSEGEQLAGITEAAISEEKLAESASPEPAPRQLVRSSFKTNSTFVPRPKSPASITAAKAKGSALNTLIASVPAPLSPSKAVPSSPSGLNALLGTSQASAIKTPLFYSRETMRTVPYQSSRAFSSQEPSSQPNSRHVTPAQQDQTLGYETPTMPPYSGRGRPRKHPLKSDTPRPRGRPRKDSSLPVPDSPRAQAYGVRGRARGRKRILRDFSARPMVQVCRII